MSFVSSNIKLSNMIFSPNGKLDVEQYRQLMISQGASASERTLKYVLAKDNDDDASSTAMTTTSSMFPSSVAVASGPTSSTALVPLSPTKRMKRTTIDDRAPVAMTRATTPLFASASASASTFGSSQSPTKKGKRKYEEGLALGSKTAALNRSISSCASSPQEQQQHTISFAAATTFGPSPANKRKRKIVDRASVVRNKKNIKRKNTRADKDRAAFDKFCENNPVSYCSTSSSYRPRQHTLSFAPATPFGPSSVSSSRMEGKRKFDDREEDDAGACVSPPPATGATTPVPAAATFFKKQEHQQTVAGVSDGDDDEKQDRKPSVCILCSNNDDDDESVVEIVVPLPTTKMAPTAAAATTVSSSDKDEDDEEVEIVGFPGNNAISVYPHAQGDCTVHLFVGPTNNDGSLCPPSPALAKTNEHCCSKCYCFVCDSPASECKEWCGTTGHCNATSTNQVWGRLRRKKRGAEKRKATLAAKKKKAAATATTKTRVVKAKCARLIGNNKKKKKAPPTLAVAVPSSTTIYQCCNSACGMRMQEKDVAITQHSSFRYCYDCIILSVSNATGHDPIHPGTKVCSLCRQQGHCLRTSKECPTYWKLKKNNTRK